MTANTWHIPLDPHTRPPLSLNDRLHWRVEARHKKELRLLVALRARMGGIPAVDRVAVELHWQPRDRRRRDADNPVPTTKACVDGLVDAGVVTDDDHTHVQHLGVVFHDPEPGHGGRLWLVVSEVTESEATS